MFWVALAAAAQISAPVPLNLKQWFHSTDTPGFLYRKGSGFWLVGLRVTVRPDGSVERCSVTNNGGLPPTLGDLTCRFVTERARFSPARLADNAPAFGVYETAFAWKTDRWPTRGLSSPQLQLEVKSLPDKKARSELVRIVYLVDSHGTPGNCMAEQTVSFESVKNEPELAQIACEQLLQSIKYNPTKDASGQAVPSVQDAVVEFAVRP